MFAIPGITGFLVYSKLHKTGGSDVLVSSDGRISLAVMPFRNMTDDSTLNIWQEGVQLGLISSLSNNRELKIRQQESVNLLLQSGSHTDYAFISTGVAGKISRKLKAALFVYGSMVKNSNKIRLDAQLINSETNEVLQSFNMERPAGEESFFRVIDTISQRLTNFLLISKLIKENPV